MNRRILFIGSFAVLIALAAWYGTATVDVPDLTFREAASINDAKKKVIVTGHLVSDQVESKDGSLAFRMRDAAGDTVRVQYEGEEPFTAEDLQRLYRDSGSLSVSGHSHGDYFHSTGMTLH